MAQVFAQLHQLDVSAGNHPLLKLVGYLADERFIGSPPRRDSNAIGFNAPYLQRACYREATLAAITTTAAVIAHTQFHTPELSVRPCLFVSGFVHTGFRPEELFQH
jgi:hypothetical protein